MKSPIKVKGINQSYNYYKTSLGRKVKIIFQLKSLGRSLK